MQKQALFPLLAILLLAACAPVSPQAPDPVASATPAPTETAPVETETPAPAVTLQPADLPLLVYHRSGGFAGIIETWEIYADGRAMSENGLLQFAPSEVSALMDEIKSLGFFDLEDSYLPKDPCCDRFFYEITVNADGKSKTVKTVDGTPDLPTNLLAVLNRVNTFISSQ